jgi:malate synthase
VWQWIRSPKGKLDDGRKVTAELVRQFIPEEMAKIKDAIGAERYEATYVRAAEIFEQMSTSAQFTEFLTLPLYEELQG